MTLPASIQRELDAAWAKTPEGELYRLAKAVRRIETLLNMDPIQAELYMASRYEEMDQK